MEQMGSLGVSGNIVVNYDGTIWIYMGGIFRSEVAGSCWRCMLEVDHQKWHRETENSVSAQDLSTIV